MSGNGLMFTGEFVHQLDEKARFKLPAKLANLFELELGRQCVMMKMPEQCLAIYPARVWQVEFQRILSASGPAMPGSADYRALTRILGANSMEVIIGAQGRVAVPDVFRSYLGVEPGENVVVVGAGVRIELWAESAWRQKQASDMANYAGIIERLSGLAVDRGTDKE